MKVLVCDGEVYSLDGVPTCSGSFSSMSLQDVANLGNGMTWEKVGEYQDLILPLFASAFLFVVLRKIL